MLQPCSSSQHVKHHSRRRQKWSASSGQGKIHSSRQFIEFISSLSGEQCHLIAQPLSLYRRANTRPLMACSLAGAVQPLIYRQRRTQLGHKRLSRSDRDSCWQYLPLSLNTQALFTATSTQARVYAAEVWCSVLRSKSIWLLSILFILSYCTLFNALPLPVNFAFKTYTEFKRLCFLLL